MNIENKNNGFVSRGKIISGIILILLVLAIISLVKKGDNEIQIKNTVEEIQTIPQTKTEATTTKNTGTSTDKQATSTKKEAIPVKPEQVKVEVKTPVVQKNNNTYKDGTYSVTGNYVSPEGREILPVQISIKDDIITDSIVTVSSKDSTSRRYQNNFADAHKTYVVGKNIKELKVSKISGASLTTKGFNDALGKVRTEASL